MGHCPDCMNYTNYRNETNYRHESLPGYGEGKIGGNQLLLQVLQQHMGIGG